MEQKKYRWQFADTLKNTDVEEVVDWWIHRPAAFQVLKLIEGRVNWITPTQLTIMSAGFGLAAGVACFNAAQGGSGWYAIGGVLMFISVILDCADGMLARLTGSGSRMGQVIDGYSDLVSGVAFWFGMSYSLTYGWEQWWVWPANFAILFSVIVHVALYDKYREFYTDHASPDASESKELDTKFKQFIASIYDDFYTAVFGLVGAGGESAKLIAPREFREIFRAPMRLISFLGLGTHLFIVYMLAFFAAWWPDATYLVLHLTITAASNVLAVIAIVHWARVDQTKFVQLQIDDAED